MNTSSFSMNEKKERARKFHIADKIGGNPLVVIAKDENNAAFIWSKRTGESATEAVVTAIGSHGISVARRAFKETKPATLAVEKEAKGK